MLSIEISFFVVNDFVNDDLVSLKRVLFCMFPFLPLIPPLPQTLHLPIVHIYRDSLFEIIFNESGAQWSRGRKEFFSH